jgi:hypothetical protein
MGAGRPFYVIPGADVSLSFVAPAAPAIYLTPLFKPL